MGTREPVIIVGGGLAGLATATALAERGIASRILESKKRLGGRATSFEAPESGELLDNCQHVVMGCCTNFRHFIRTLGLEGQFRKEKTLYFVGPEGRISRFSSNPGPAPLHLLCAGLRLNYLAWREKLALASGLRALAKPLPPDRGEERFSVWLRRHRQPLRAIERFWEVVLISALSESMDRITVAHARKVFVDGFLTNRQAWVVEIPAVPLGELYGGPIQQWLSQRGTTLETGATVERLVLAKDRVKGVQLKSGAVIEGSEFVLAVPWFRLAQLLPETLREQPLFANAAKLEAAPISSVHLWLDRPLTSLPHAVLIGRLSQWMFNRTVLEGQTEAAARDQTWYYQIVISASRNLAGKSQAEIQRQILVELAGIWPSARQAQVRRSLQVTEHRAVFSVQPGVELLRPAQQTAIANLQLAGDWTRTGWPSTMEGAVRSGYLAAEGILQRLGQPNQCLQPDLPVSWLTRSWMKESRL